MIFLNYYTGFPFWVRIFGIIAILPFLVNMIKIDMNQYDYRHDYGYDIAGFLMLQTVGLFWSYYAFHPWIKERASKATIWIVEFIKAISKNLVLN